MTAVMAHPAPANDQSWCCTPCNKTFLRRSVGCIALHRFPELCIHGLIPDWPCSSEHLLRHNRQHANTNRHECPICTPWCRLAATLRTWFLPLCAVWIVWLDSFKTHALPHHTLQAPVCCTGQSGTAGSCTAPSDTVGFHRSDHYQFHLKSHANVKAKPYECTHNQCNKRYDRLPVLPLLSLPFCYNLSTHCPVFVASLCHAHFVPPDRYSHMYSLKRHQSSTSHAGIRHHEVELDVDQLRKDYAKAEHTKLTDQPLRAKRMQASTSPVLSGEPSAKRPTPNVITLPKAIAPAPVQMPMSGNSFAGPVSSMFSPQMLAAMLAQHPFGLSLSAAAPASCMPSLPGLPLVSLANMIPTPMTTVAGALSNGLSPSLLQIYPALRNAMMANQMEMLVAVTSAAATMGTMSGLTTIPSSTMAASVLAQLRL